MKGIFRFLLLLFYTGAPLVAVTQTNTGLVYDNDPLLYNGRIYAFYPPPGTGGTHYLNEKFDTNGSVLLRGITYTNLTLNYDVYNQQLVLSYVNAMGSRSLISISQAWLETFSLGNRNFKMFAGPESDTTRRIYQVLGNGSAKILYFSKKELLIDTRTVTKQHFFSDVIREMYVMSDSQLMKYKNNRSFVAAFSQSRQDSIKKYMRKHKIKVKKANDFIMTDLINYCNTATGL